MTKQNYDNQIKYDAHERGDNRLKTRINKRVKSVGRKERKPERVTV